MDDRKPEDDGTLSRRELLRAAGLAGIGLTASSVAGAHSSEEEAVQARRSQQRQGGRRSWLRQFSRSFAATVAFADIRPHLPGGLGNAKKAMY